MLAMELWPYGLVSYAVAHFLHVLYWRFARPKQHFSALLLALIVLPLFFCCAALFIRAGFALPETTALVPLLAPAVLHLALATSYTALFPVFQASSPTLLLLTELRPQGRVVAEDTLYQLLEDRSTPQDRLADLQNSQLVVEQGHRFHLTSAGKLLAQIFVCYRIVLGLPRGQG